MGWNYLSFPNFNSITIEVCKWISNFIPLFVMDEIIPILWYRDMALPGLIMFIWKQQWHISRFKWVNEKWQILILTHQSNFSGTQHSFPVNHQRKCQQNCLFWFAWANKPTDNVNSSYSMLLLRQMCFSSSVNAKYYPLMVLYLHICTIFFSEWQTASLFFHADNSFSWNKNFMT